MGLRVYPEIIQGTDEWHDQRRGMVTASVVGKLITERTLGAIEFACPACGAQALASCQSKVAKNAGQPIKTIHPERTAVAHEADEVILGAADNDDSRGLTALLVAERITGFTDPTYVSDDMLRGIDDEPRAVARYSERYAPVDTTGFMVRDDWGFRIGYSPDGLVGEDGLVEVKSRRQKKQLQTIVSGQVPAENMAQLQCGLLVSGRQWIDYVSYCGGMHMWPQRVLPDERWFDAIVAAVAQLEANATEMTAAYEDATDGLVLTERSVELEMVI